MIEELKALAEKATQEKLADGGRYFEGSCDDLTKCRHYETGEYQNEADGKLIEALWNNLPAILTALEAVPVMKEALEDIARLGNEVRIARLAAEERGKKVALEAAAKVADSFDSQEPYSCNCGDQLATAIRQIDPASLGAE